MKLTLIANGLILAAAVILSGCSDKDSPDAPYSDETITQNNRAVGLMGRFDYAAAQQLFSQLLRDNPGNSDITINLAIATLNRQLEGDEDAALALLKQLVKNEPDNLQARYLLGLLHIRRGDAATALSELQGVINKDPTDAHAHYFLGQAQELNSDFTAALGSYQKSAELDPYLRSAYYAAFVLQRRLQQKEAARESLALYQRLADNPRAQLAEFKYTRMGPRAEVNVIANAPASPTTPEGQLFNPAQPLLEGMQISGEQPGITVADINGDGVLDLFINGAATDAVRHNTVLLGQADGSYAEQRDHPLAMVAGVKAALWGDLDNDGLNDLYLCRKGGNRLWRQAPEAGWYDASMQSGASGAADTIDGLMFDADHDGDLDIYTVNADGSNELWNNNLDGSFRPLAAEQQIAGSAQGSRQVLALDLDNDRDTDILVINARAPHDIYINDRLWNYRQGEGFDALRQANISHTVASDIDADGTTELLTLDAEGRLSQWKPDVQGVWTAKAVGKLTMSPDILLAAVDINGDGSTELLQTGTQGWAVDSILPGRGEPLTHVKRDGLVAFTTLNDAPGKGPALLALSENGELLKWGAGSGRHPFLHLQLSGLDKQADSMRSNSSGVGTRVAVRQGSLWSIGDTFRHHSGPGQSLQPLALGLGGSDRADFVALTWSDGVFQTELGLESGALHQISETQRQLSSCPVLFAWDGERYAFISDILGVGGMGYMVAPGEYAPPRPHENFLMPAGLLQPRDGRYEIKIGEPMEEAAYLDAIRLVAYDLPPGWQMVLDERMGILGSDPTGKPLYYRQERLPNRVTNTAGEEVTALVASVDLQAPEVGELDKRFIGRLQAPYSLTLEFEQPLEAVPGQPVLMADGWVEYPYSQTMFSAWQAGAEFQAPTLEARGGDGRWQVVAEQFGYPAGMPRRMALPITELPANTTALRLTTNQEIYWDRLAIIYSEAAPQMSRHELPLLHAEVGDVGFAQRTTGAQHQPHYDYARRSPLWDTRHMSGSYTAFGEATALVTDADDAVAIIGPGEELHLEYDDRLPSLQPDWQRQFVIESHGWAKDMDLFTQHGATLAPLPTTGKARDRVVELHATYNTRQRSGY